jgi:hypothetical protein
VAGTIAVAASVVPILGMLINPQGDPGPGILFWAASTSAAVVGAILIVRAPGNHVGPLLVLSGVVLNAWAVLSGYAEIGAGQTPPWPGVGVVDAITQTLLFVPIVIVLVVVPLVFPDGHLLSPRWRWMVALIVAALSAAFLQSLIAPDQSGPAGVVGFVGAPALAPLAAALGRLATAGAVGAFAGSASAVWIRFRDGSSIERQQLKWLLAVAALAAIFFPLAFLIQVPGVTEGFFLLGVLTLIALPIAIAVAITRYHLYDIDRIISRTISYAVITALLGVTFAGLVLGITAAFGSVTESSTIAVAAATLAVFALFQPVRQTVQRSVDRRFNRQRIDAEEATAAFATHLRDELDLGALVEELARAGRNAVEPSSTSIWLRRP